MTTVCKFYSAQFLCIPIGYRKFFQPIRMLKFSVALFYAGNILYNIGHWFACVHNTELPNTWSANFRVPTLTTLTSLTVVVVMAASIAHTVRTWSVTFTKIASPTTRNISAKFASSGPAKKVHFGHFFKATSVGIAGPVRLEIATFA